MQSSGRIARWNEAKKLVIKYSKLFLIASKWEKFQMNVSCMPRVASVEQLNLKKKIMERAYRCFSIPWKLFATLFIRSRFIFNFAWEEKKCSQFKVSHGRLWYKALSFWPFQIYFIHLSERMYNETASITLFLFIPHSQDGGERALKSYMRLDFFACCKHVCS